MWFCLESEMVLEIAVLLCEAFCVVVEVVDDRMVGKMHSDLIPACSIVVSTCLLQPAATAALRAVLGSRLAVSTNPGSRARMSRTMLAF